MVPYFSVSAIVITIKLLTEGHAYVENPVTWMSYVKMLYLPEAGYFLWFIWALWWMLCRPGMVNLLFVAVIRPSTEPSDGSGSG